MALNAIANYAERSSIVSATRTIPEIQILRFVAASMVLISHLQHEVLTRNFLDTSAFSPFEPIFWSGGVDVFFIISGFIMYHLSRDLFGREGAPSGFLLRRLIRVAPPYWAFTLAILLAMILFRDQIIHSTPSPQQIFGSFLFLPLRDPYGSWYPVLIAGWTLNFEMLFYAIFALGLRFRRLVGMGVIVAILAAFGLPQYFFKVEMVPFAFWCNPIIFEFLFGIGLAQLRASGLRVTPAVGWLWFIVGIAMMIGFKTTGLTALGGLTRPFWMGLPALIACTGPALIRETPNLRAGVVGCALVFGGDVSYALYLSHPFTINLVAFAAPHVGISNPWTYIVVGAVAALAGAAATYLVAERPLTNWLNHALVRRKPATLAESPAVGL